jgi:hypothetical protein
MPRNPATVERKSDREVDVTRSINGPARILFEAFTKAALLEASTESEWVAPPRVVRATGQRGPYPRRAPVRHPRATAE